MNETMAHGSDISDKIDTCIVLAHVALERVSAKTEIGTLLAQRDILALKLALTKLKLALKKSYIQHKTNKTVQNKNPEITIGTSAKSKRAPRSVNLAVYKKSRSTAEAILGAMEGRGFVSSGDIEALLPKLSKRTIYRYLKSLLAQGVIAKHEDADTYAYDKQG